MTPDDLKRWQSMQSIIDGLLRRALNDRAWIIALYGRVVDLESERGGRSSKEVKADLAKTQKKCLQKLFEDIESRNPAYAAELDNRKLDELL